MAFGTSAAATLNPAHVWLPSNLLDVAETVAWTSNGETDASGANLLDDSDYPLARLNDYRASLRSQPNTAANTTVYLNLGWSSAVKPTVAGIVMHGHNFADAPVTVTVEVADDAAYSSNLTEIHDFGQVTDDKRLVAIFASRYTNVEHMRIKMVAGAGHKPQLGECFVFASASLGNLRVADGPLQPYDDRMMRSRLARVESDAGDVVSYERFLGQSIKDYRYRFGRDEETTKLRAVWKTARKGARAVYVIEDPSDADLASRTYLLSLPNELAIKNTAGRYTREVAFECVELAPFVETES